MDRPRIPHNLLFALDRGVPPVLTCKDPIQSPTDNTDKARYYLYGSNLLIVMPRRAGVMTCTYLLHDVSFCFPSCNLSEPVIERCRHHGGRGSRARPPPQKYYVAVGWGHKTRWFNASITAAIDSKDRKRKT